MTLTKEVIAEPRPITENAEQPDKKEELRAAIRDVLDRVDIREALTLPRLGAQKPVVKCARINAIANRLTGEILEIEDPSQENKNAESDNPLEKPNLRVPIGLVVGEEPGKRNGTQAVGHFAVYDLIGADVLSAEGHENFYRTVSELNVSSELAQE